MDITPVFNQVLAAHNAQPLEPYVFRLQDLDEFLKEAYRIVGHVARWSTNGQLTTAASAHCRASYIFEVDTAELPFYCASTAAEANSTRQQLKRPALRRQRRKVPHRRPAN